MSVGVGILALSLLAAALLKRTAALSVRAPPRDSSISTRFTHGLLALSLPPPQQHSGNILRTAFAETLVNDTLITAAVRLMADQGKLRVLLQGQASESATGNLGEVRAYVGELYRQLWDASCLGNKPLLDVTVLWPDGGGKALLEADLQVVIGEGTGAAAVVNKANQLRQEAGLALVEQRCLDEAAAACYRDDPSYFYCEETSRDGVIPSFPRVACGGTFDNLHCGHKKMLSMAASIVDVEHQGTLTVGVTSDEMLKSKQGAHLIRGVEQRCEGVRAFLSTVMPELITRIVVLSDPFGPPIHEEDCSAIVCSSETIKGAEKINSIRAEKGFPPLSVVVTRRTEASSLSSSCIRNWQTK
ncbi:unnamed protein product [Chrysoparadoxa australica]